MAKHLRLFSVTALLGAAVVAGCSNTTPSDAAGGNVVGLNQSVSGVSLYLWKASLDTISFMPITSADPFGGLIITDWYAPPETPAERFKLNIALGRQLRADGVHTSVFRQVQGHDGGWVDSPVDPKTSENLENEILTRARQLRAASVPTAN